MKNALTDELKLTDAEKRLISVMMNPDNFDLPVRQICKIADCSTPTYYAAIKKPYFTRELKRRTTSMVVDAIPDIVKALIREAKTGSFNHIRLALEMAGLYSTNVNINQKSVHVIVDGRDVAKLNDDELLEVAKKYGIVDKDVTDISEIKEVDDEDDS